MQFGVFIYDGTEPIDLAAYGVLSMARRIRPDIQICTIAPRPGVVQLTNGLMCSSIGTIIEWYDFLIYGTAAALVFNTLFFPNIDPLTGTLASLGTYAVGFFARPWGRAVRTLRRSNWP
jgi:hypothetical protein